MVVKTKGFIVGAAAGALLTGAAVAGATAGLNVKQDRSPVLEERPELIRTQNLTRSLVRPPAGAPMSFADIIQRVSPAVVSLEVRGTAPRGATGPGSRALPPSLEEFFGLTPRGGQGGQGQQDEEGGEEGENQRTQASGSGFFISADGYIVTNNHVVENAREITVHLSDERELKARVVGRDEDTDLAVLKVEGRNFPFVQFATDAQPRVGDWVVAIGNPFQLNGTATAGIVSAKGRDLPGEAFVDYLQIDAPINRGNSGGPTFDLNGRVVGVNTAIYSTSGSSAGVGFAIPSDTAEQVTRALMSGGRITRGYLGASVGDVDRDIADAEGLREARGAFISDVQPNTPAARAGVQAGDIVLSVNGRAIADASALTRAVAATRSGQPIRLEVARGGGRRTIEVISGVRPSKQELANLGRGVDSAPGAAPSSPPLAEGPPVLGLSLAPLDESVRRRFSQNPLTRGVVVTRVDPDSDAANKGVERGLVVTRVGDREVSTPAEVRAAVETAQRQNRSAVQFWFRTPQTAQNVPLALRLQPRADG